MQLDNAQCLTDYFSSFILITIHKSQNKVMVKICFKRVGKKKYPVYRIVVLDKQKDPWGNYLENLGTYNPHTKELNLNGDKIKEWIAKGAQPSDTIHNLLVEKGVIKGEKRRVSTLSQKRKDRLAKKEKVAKAAVEEAPKAPVVEDAPAKQKPVEEKPAEAPPEEKVELIQKLVQEEKNPVEEAKPEEPAKEEGKHEEKSEEK